MDKLKRKPPIRMNSLEVGSFLQLYVRTEKGVIMTMEMDSSDTLEMLKAKVKDNLGFDFDRKKVVIFQGNVFLDINDRSLGDYGIINGNTLHIRIQDETVTINVQVNGGDLLSINLKVGSTVRDLSQALSEQTGIPIDSQSLSQDGQTLDHLSESSLEAIGIMDNDTLDLEGVRVIAIRVELTNGNEAFIEIRSDASYDELLQRVAVKEKDKVSNIRLMLRREELNQEETLGEQGLDNNKTLICLKVPRPPTKPKKKPGRLLALARSLSSGRSLMKSTSASFERASIETQEEIFGERGDIELDGKNQKALKTPALPPRAAAAPVPIANKSKARERGDVETFRFEEQERKSTTVDEDLDERGGALERQEIGEGYDEDDDDLEGVDFGSSKESIDAEEPKKDEKKKKQTKKQERTVARRRRVLSYMKDILRNVRSFQLQNINSQSLQSYACSIQMGKWL